MAKILSDEEYQEIVDAIMKNEYAAENVSTARGKLEKEASNAGLDGSSSRGKY